MAIPGGAPRAGHTDPVAARRAEVLAAVTDRGAIRVTELAAELGVSAVTVRRAVSELAGSGQVRRVHGGAEAVEPVSPLGTGTDERPPRAADLEPLGGRTVGVLIPSLDYYWPGVVRGMQEALASHGMRMLLRGSRYDAPDELDDVARLLDSGVDGLLMAPTVQGAGGAAMRDWLATGAAPVVLVERTAAVGREHVEVESVLTDHSAGAATAVYHLASQGHVRIGIVCTEISLHAGELRHGWAGACADLGLPTTGVPDLDLPERRGPGFVAAVEAAIDTALSTGTTALLVHSDPEAIQVAQSAIERGLRIPDDLAVVAYDDEVAAFGTPPLTAVRPPRGALGHAAVELLAARLADPARPVHRVTVTPTLNIRRSSVGPVPAVQGGPGDTREARA
ncbi:MAG TPA: substrate-binding domain-containing protein [Cellulomonas sp.]